VLDTSAILAYLEAEPGAQQVREVLRTAKRKQLTALFCLINYGECLYITERRRGLTGVQDAVHVIDQLALAVIPADRELTFAAAHLKALHPISYADAFAAALAQRHRGRLMTGDPEFKAVEREVAIRWLPAR
jgi:ribonuclease VapC